MKITADVIDNVMPSTSAIISQKARDMRENGVDVIALSAGEPDFDTPQWIKTAAWQALQDGHTKYPPIAGLTQLRSAISKKLKNDYNLTYSFQDIIVTHGAKQALYNAFAASLNKDDEVIISAPYWTSYTEMVTLNGGKPIIIHPSITDSHKITPKLLENAITPRTKWILFNSPSNPSGAVYSKNELQALAKVLLKYPHVWIMSDDVYDKFIYTDVPFCNFAQISPLLFSRTLVINSFSKTYAMTGWRIGYAAGPSALIRAMHTVQSQSTSGVCTMSQWAGIAALEGNQQFLLVWQATFKKRRDMVVDMLNKAHGLKCALPEGAFYAYPSCKELIGYTTPKGKIIDSDTAFAEALLEEAHVALVPGSAFGASPYVRLSYAASEAALFEACTRIKAFCARLIAPHHKTCYPQP